MVYVLYIFNLYISEIFRKVKIMILTFHITLTMVVAGKYVRIILNPNLVTFSCIGIRYGGLDE